MSGRTVILSSHLDDAAFCLGAALLEGALGQVEVINSFTVSDYAATSAAGQTSRVTDIRRREDDRFFARIPNLRSTCLDRLDAPLRLGIPWQTVCDARSLRSSEEEIRILLAALETHLGAARDALVLAPLALGHHIDHRVVRQAALRHLHTGGAVGFYEDLPYAATIALPAIEAAAADLARRARRKLAPHLLFARGRPANKAAAIRIYRSQLSRSTVERVIGHGRRLDRRGFAERIWLCSRAAALLPASDL